MSVLLNVMVVPKVGQEKLAIPQNSKMRHVTKTLVINGQLGQFVQLLVVEVLDLVN